MNTGPLYTIQGISNLTNYCNSTFNYHVKCVISTRKKTSVFLNMAMKCLFCLLLTKKKSLQSNSSTPDSYRFNTVCYQILQKSGNGAKNWRNWACQEWVLHQHIHRVGWGRTPLYSSTWTHVEMKNLVIIQWWHTEDQRATKKICYRSHIKLWWK